NNLSVIIRPQGEWPFWGGLDAGKDLVSVTVAACLLANLDSPAQRRKDVFEIRDDGPHTLSFRSEREHFLFEIQVERQGSGQEVGKGGVSAIGKILLGVGERQDLLVQVDGAGGLVLGRRLRVVGEIENLTPQEGTFLIDRKKFKALPALGNDIHAAIVVGFGDGDDFGGAADVGQAFIQHPEDAEYFLLLQTFSNHFFVTRFENVERQGCAGK